MTRNGTGTHKDCDPYEIAKNRAEKIEQADSAEDAGLIGDDVLDVNYRVGADGTLREVEIATTVGGPDVRVRIFGGSVTASWASNSATVPVFDHKGGEEILEDARNYWTAHAEATEITV